MVICALERPKHENVKNPKPFSVMKVRIKHLMMFPPKKSKWRLVIIQIFDPIVVQLLHRHPDKTSNTIDTMLLD